MGRRSSDSEDDSRSRRKKKQRRRSSSSSSSSSSSNSKVVSSRSRKSTRLNRSRSRDKDKDRSCIGIGRLSKQRHLNKWPVAGPGFLHPSQVPLAVWLLRQGQLMEKKTFQQQLVPQFVSQEEESQRRERQREEPPLTQIPQPRQERQSLTEALVIKTSGGNGITGGLRFVIGLAVSEEQVGWAGGVLGGGGGVGGGDVQNDGIDDEPTPTRHHLQNMKKRGARRGRVHRLERRE
ncbi:hypothetical protein JOQ06_017284, partial [Pogonophryne albipinna]